MKKHTRIFFFLLYIIISTLVLVFYVGPVRAQWKDEPISFINEFAGWNEIGKYQPSILLDGEQLKMWFTTFDGAMTRIAYATSSDGTQWVHHGPVFSVSNLNVHDPTVIREDDRYVMWYAADVPNVPGIRIYRAVSTDGLVWSQEPVVPVLEPIPGSWNTNTVTSPFVRKDEMGYHMWFTGHGNNWNIGTATSADGITWVEESANPLIPGGDGASVLRRDGSYELYHHRYGICGQGIYRVTSSDGVLWEGISNPEQVACVSADNPGQYTAPSAVSFQGKTYVYYTNIDPINYGSIRLATIEHAQFMTPTPTPTVIPTTHPTATPIPTIISGQQKIPVVLIPGMFASWNKEAVLHNREITYADWIENPIVKEYDGVKSTFTRLGYTKNTDLYIFSYDWRDPVSKTAENFKAYLRDTVGVVSKNKKVNIVGHSLGGIIARIYAQKYGTESINKIVTIGSPHKGTAKVYKPYILGQIDNENSYYWLAQRVVVELYRTRGETVQRVLSEHFPVLGDLLPTYGYIDGNGNAPRSLLLETYADVQSIGAVFFTGGSTSYDTLFGYTKKRNRLTTVNRSGDGMITALSSLYGSNRINLNGNHGEVIYSKENIRKILDALGITYSGADIAQGSGTKVFPSMLVLVKSPVQVSVVHNRKTYSEKEGILLIPGEPDGQYEIRAIGKDRGHYTIMVGMFSQSTAEWKKFAGEIKKVGQTDSYTVKGHGKGTCGK